MVNKTKMTSTIHDDIYGDIHLSPPIIANIIQTSLFQRLKHITQLGIMLITRPSANHTRYDHSIGTFHLTRKMLNALEENSSGHSCMIHNPCWQSYRLAVEIAALLHDIGHGPFSHTWDCVVGGFHHEENGVACVDAIFDALPDVPIEFQPDARYWIELIKSLIVGQIPSRLPAEYLFIFEIMNNSRCGIDVDKWDYLLRDSYRLKCSIDVPTNFDDLFLKARIASDGSCIEYRYCDYSLIHDLFEARQRMHLHYYRTPINVICEDILADVVNQCDTTLCGMKLNEITSANMSAFVQLTDAKVLDIIKNENGYKLLQDFHRIHIESGMEKPVETSTNRKYKTIIVENIMPAEEKIKFYGNECDKPKIERSNSVHSQMYLFTLPANL